MKKLLSIIISACLLISSTSVISFAAPGAVGTVGSAEEVTDEIDTSEAEKTQGENTDSENEAVLSEGPFQISVKDSAAELESDSVPDNYSDGQLMFDIGVYAGGDGSEESPYEINDAEQLLYFSQTVNAGTDAGAYYKLTANIDLNGTSWTPVGFHSSTTGYTTVFSGNFDGNGYTISNVTINSASTSYVGFFGFLYNATVKNLTLDNVTIDIYGDTKTEYYVGALAGRVVSMGALSYSEISNCNITNSSITATANETIYAGGICGFSIADAYTDIKITNTTADCDISIMSYAYSGTNISSIAGGLIGYIGALTNGTYRLRNCVAHGDITIDDTNTTEALYGNIAMTFGGGAIGQAACYVAGEPGGTAYIYSCSATGDVTGSGNTVTLCGGFMGIASCAPNMNIYDCYASGNVTGTTYGISANDYAAIGGFLGQLDYLNYTPEEAIIFSTCYAAGDVIASAPKNNEGYVGRFVGYSFAPSINSDCYKLESTTETGNEIFVDGLTVIPEEMQSSAESYEGFNFETVWIIDSAADYPYPVPVTAQYYATFLSYDGTYFSEANISASGKVPVPASTPVKEATAEFTYTFSYWTMDGESAFDFENRVVTSDVLLVAVFEETARSYDISFYSEGELFEGPVKYVYESTVLLPENEPEKPETERYRYVFMHWSETEDGDEFDFSNYVVTANKSFYAVFSSVDKSAWDGEIAESFSEGNGTEALPYIIKTGEELALLQTLVNSGEENYSELYYALGADLQLGYSKWFPIGTLEYPFSGSFDGNGYSISGYKVTGENYFGLFGVVTSATIKNLYLYDFEINISPESTSTIYVGGVAGLANTDESADTIISNIFVNASRFEVNATGAAYVGGIAGKLEGVEKTYQYAQIADSYVTNDITYTGNASGWIGGITGYLRSTNSVVSNMKNVYYKGTIKATSEAGTIVGGLAGFVWSYGSAYIPEVPIPTGTTDGELAAADGADTLISNSFAIANVYLYSSNSSSYAGALAGRINDYATTKASYYQRGTTIYASNGQTASIGISTSSSNLLSSSYISGTLGFDLTNTWTYITGYSYPVLKVMYSDKPVLRLSDLDYSDNTVTANITVLAKSQSYTVVFSVYNTDNRLASVKRFRITDSTTVNELAVELPDIRNAQRVTVSVMDNTSFAPLFTAIERETA